MDKIFDKMLSKFVDRVDKTILKIATTLINEIDEIKKLMALMITEQRKTNQILERRR